MGYLDEERRKVLCRGVGGHPHRVPPFRYRDTVIARVRETSIRSENSAFRAIMPLKWLTSAGETRMSINESLYAVASGFDPRRLPRHGLHYAR